MQYAGYMPDDPDLKTMVEHQYHTIIEDMDNCGYRHLIWTDMALRSTNEFETWLESCDYQVSYVSQIFRACYGFKRKSDAVLFKLRWL